MCIVDSFGHLYREQIDHLYNKYTAALAGTGKEIGIHAHNNMQLAFANTIEAIILGANRIDATMGGLGRGAGNCHMELLLGFLAESEVPLRPIIRLLQDHIEPLKATVEWGPLVPYNITGQMNLHPRAAMQFRASNEKDDYVKVLRPGGGGYLKSRQGDKEKGRKGDCASAMVQLFSLSPRLPLSLSSDLIVFGRQAGILPWKN